MLLRLVADRTGLTGELGPALARPRKSPQVDRGVALDQIVESLWGDKPPASAHGTLRDYVKELRKQLAVTGESRIGTVPGGYVFRIGPGELDLLSFEELRAEAMQAARDRAWAMIEATPAGFPWLEVAGKALPGWLVIDLDATLITARSDKEGAAPTWKKGYGFHPLGAWLANTSECLALLLRPGNAGSNTVTDHVDVLGDARKQVPARFRSKVIVRVDGAGATHDLMEHLLAIASPRRQVLFTCGWAITAADEEAIALLPASAWKPGVDRHGHPEQDKHVAEVTHLMSRAGNWAAGLRWIVRRARPSRRQAPNLTAFEKKTGWRYSITCTNIPLTGIPGVPGSHHPQLIDVLHRQHAVVEDGVRGAKAMGLRNLPSKAWQVNCGWVLAASIAADLAAWTRLIGLHDQDGLAGAEPQTLRYRLWHLPARLTAHARQRVLKISPAWPWKDAFLTCWERLTALPVPA